MKDKFTREYVKNLLSKDFLYETLTIASDYSYSFPYNYDNKEILHISYPYNIAKLSLDQVEELHSYLGDIIEYYKTYDKNPTLLTVEEKKEILFNTIKENEKYISSLLEKMDMKNIDELLDELVCE